MSSFRAEVTSVDRGSDARSAAAPAFGERHPESLVDVLQTTLKLLAAAGNVEAACELAAKACVILRRDRSGDERRFDALLHRLCRHLNW